MGSQAQVFHKIPECENHKHHQSPAIVSGWQLSLNIQTTWIGYVWLYWDKWKTVSKHTFSYKLFSIMDDQESQRHARYIPVRHRLICQISGYITLLLTFIISAQAVLLLPNQWLPYHTSILTGQGWVEELLDGHPERICCELGMHKETFLLLINGYSRSKYMSLEEQLAIFLYMCVMGLSIRHTGERFQHSNETISQ